MNSSHPSLATLAAAGLLAAAYLFSTGISPEPHLSEIVTVEENADAHVASFKPQRLRIQSVQRHPLPMTPSRHSQRIKGRVLTDRGVPVVDAEVVAEGGPCGPVHLAVTDDHGEFDVLVPAKMRMAALSQNHGSGAYRSVGGDTAVELTVYEYFGQIKGCVTNSLGQPLCDFVVEFVSADGVVHTWARPILTGSDGFFLMDNVPEGVYEGWLCGAGLDEAFIVKVVANEQTELVTLVPDLE